MTVRYVFWDSDNTLVNTHQHHWRKNVETLKKYGIVLDDKWEKRVYHNNSLQNWEWMHEKLGLSASREDYIREVDAWYFAHIDEIPVRDGVPEALSLFEEAGLPMCVVSNGRKRSVMAALDAKGLSPRFQFIFCKEDYEGRKPDPGPYLSAKTKMQQIAGKEISLKECLAIEDDPKGVESAENAGMQVLHRALDDLDTASFLRRCKELLG